MIEWNDFRSSMKPLILFGVFLYPIFVLMGLGAIPVGLFWETVWFLWLCLSLLLFLFVGVFFIIKPSSLPQLLEVGAAFFLYNALVVQFFMYLVPSILFSSDLIGSIAYGSALLFFVVNQVDLIRYRVATRNQSVHVDGSIMSLGLQAHMWVGPFFTRRIASVPIIGFLILFSIAAGVWLGGSLGSLLMLWATAIFASLGANVLLIALLSMISGKGLYGEKLEERLKNEGNPHGDQK